MNDNNIKTLKQIQEEIKNYPTPVDHHDTYFDFLLSERDRITKAAVGVMQRIIMETELINEENAPTHTHGGGVQDYEYDKDER